MKFSSVKALLVAIVAVLTVSQSVLAAEERVVATVNGNMIMESQVLRALGKKAKTEANRQAALDNLIDEMLVQQAVKKLGIKIDPRQVDLAIEDVAARNGLTYGQLLDALDYQGISLNQYRQQIAQQMLMEAVRHQSIGQAIQVNPDEVRAKAQEMLAKDKANGKLKTVNGLEHRISHILIKTTPVLNDKQAKAKLSNIIADIKAGKTTFEQAAKANSVDYVSAADGGDLGFNFLETYDPTFAQVASKAKKNEISAPFKSQFGWHILKVTDTRQADRTEDAYAQRAYESIVNKQAQEASQDWIKTLRKSADIQYVNSK